MINRESKCSHCGKKFRTSLLDMNNYAYKYGSKVYCCYACFRAMEKKRLAKSNARIDRQLLGF